MTYEGRVERKDNCWMATIALGENSHLRCYGGTAKEAKDKADKSAKEDVGIQVVWKTGDKGSE